MGWKETGLVSLRVEFVELSRCGGVDFTELCRRFGISRKTGYKWLRRARDHGGQEPASWAADRSRRPQTSPSQTPLAMEEAIVSVRREHPAWGARKIARVLVNRGEKEIPAPSTITAILCRRGLLSEEEARGRQPHQRFEREEPNSLWQMDFKGHFALEDGGRCHPLVVVDDRSRYLIALEARLSEREHDVKEVLTGSFRTHGLPFEMLMDNGPVWGSRDVPTRLAVWLMRLLIRISHGRPYHPQTQGKCERLNRSLKAEVLPEGVRFRDLGESQHALDRFRRCYNQERPHEALAFDAPAQHYRPSAIPFPEQLAPIEYLPGDSVRRVTSGGFASFQSRFFPVGRAFVGEPVAMRPTIHDGIYDVYYCHTLLRRIDLREPSHTKYQSKRSMKYGIKTTGPQHSQ